MRTIVVLLLTAVLSHAQAGLLFSTTEYQSGAEAKAGNNSDQHLVTSPPDSLPMSTSALATAGNGNVASSSGLADTGLLTATAETRSVGAETAALGGGSFFGTFSTGPGTLVLQFRLDTAGEVDGVGNAQSAGKATVTLISNDEALYEESFQAPALVNKSFELREPASGSLNVLLFSLAGSTNASALNTSTAHFQIALNAVPEPSCLLMVLAAIPFLLALARRTRADPA